MIAALLNLYYHIFRQPWPKQTIPDHKWNLKALELYLIKSCILSKSLSKLPPWVLRSLLDNDVIITPMVHDRSRAVSSWVI